MGDGHPLVWSPNEKAGTNDIKGVAASREKPQSFKETTVGPVILYDEKHGTQLLDTLKAYMECNGNISEVAELLHVHKQSVRYRLRRITELTGFDVTKFQDAAQLYLALRATELL
jgi:DNA-binding PucR family transcriptional regulator